MFWIVCDYRYVLEHYKHSNYIKERKLTPHNTNKLENKSNVPRKLLCTTEIIKNKTKKLIYVTNCTTEISNNELVK